MTHEQGPRGCVDTRRTKSMRYTITPTPPTWTDAVIRFNEFAKMFVYSPLAMLRARTQDFQARGSTTYSNVRNITTDRLQLRMVETLR